jgi:hypothetical protein
MSSDWDEEKYFAFEPGSEATLFRDHNYQTVYPCYSYNNYTTSAGECVLVALVSLLVD